MFKTRFLLCFLFAQSLSCPNGQFKTAFVEECVDCPINAKLTCDNEGLNKENCRESCVSQSGM